MTVESKNKENPRETESQKKPDVFVKPGQTERSKLMTQVEKQKENLNKTAGDILALGQEEILETVSGGIKNADLVKGKEFGIVFGRALGLPNALKIQKAIGLRNVLPPEIREVTVVKGGQSIRAVRRGFKGNFYTEGTGNYVQIMEGDKVRIENAMDASQLEKDKKDFESNRTRYADMLKDQKIDDKEKKRLSENSAETGVDPMLMVALKNVFKSGMGTEELSDSFAGIELAYKYTQTAMLRFERENPGKKMSDEKGNYTADFIVFLCSHFNLFGDYEETLMFAGRNLLKEYAALKNLGEAYYKDARPEIFKRTAYSRSQKNGTFGREFKDITGGPGGDTRGRGLAESAEFRAEAQAVASRIGVSLADLYKVMWKESGINTHAVNPISGATGLIQFIPSTAKGMGTSVHEIRNMTPLQQLSLVERYYRPYAGRVKDYVDLYLVTFYPYALGKGDDYVFGSQNGTAEKNRNQNQVIANFSSRPDRLIDNKAFRAYALAKTPAWIDAESGSERQAVLDSGTSTKVAAKESKTEKTEGGSENLSEERKMIVAKAMSYVDTPRPEFRSVDVNGGLLACAKVASTILCDAGKLNSVVLGVNDVQDELIKRGWKLQENPKPGEVKAGDVVIWAAVGGGGACPSAPDYSPGHKHIGIAVGPNEAVNNSSGKRMPVKTEIFKKRPVEAVLKPPEA